MRIFLLFGLLFLFACNEGDNKFVSAGFAFKDTIPKKAPWIDTIHAAAKAKLIDAYFTDLDQKGFNGNVLIAQQGHVVYKKSFGFADHSKKTKLHDETVFQIASASKQFTAVSILMLVERGLVKLDDVVNKYIPEFPYEGISIRMLLAHRSGLPNYMYFTDQMCRDTCVSLSNKELLDIMIKHKPELYNKPDRRFYYNNTNYAVLAAIVELVSGQAFADFVKKNIFEKCGMKNSFIRDDYNYSFPANTAVGHYGNRRRIDENFMNGITGDKGVYSSTGDLFKWEQALFNSSLIDDSLLTLAFEPQNEEKRNGQNYGFGWRICSLETCSPVVYHAGWWQGYKSCLVHLDRDKSSIIVLSNVANSGFHLQHVEEMLKILYGEYAELQ